MKGYVIDHYVSVKELPEIYSTSLPDPVAGPGEILVDVYASALNFFDILQVQGKYQHQPPFPFIPGMEFAGIVSADSPIPKGCPFIPGKTRVFGSGQGAFAEKVHTAWDKCFEIPSPTMGFEEAAGLSVTFPTSYAALVDRAELKAGEVLLVHAAAGGVGLAALQIGKALGAIVIATAGSPAKLQVCKDNGADFVVDYTKEGWQKEVLKITNGKGANVIYDPVGMAVPSLKCIAWKGRVIIIGFAAGTIEKIPANLILLKNIAVTGLHWGAYMQHEPEAIPKQWAAIFELFRQKKIKGVVFDKVYTLDSLSEGLRALGARETWGKVLLKVREEGANREAKL